MKIIVLALVSLVLMMGSVTMENELNKSMNHSSSAH